MKSSSDLLVAPAGADAARYACEHWHYSRSTPVGKLVRFGVWEAGRFVGVIIFSRGASPQLAKSFGLAQTELCELTRVAFRSHDVPVTRALAIALRLLKKANPGLRLVVSFADSAQGHTGAIYKAGNWLFLGRTAPKFEFRDRYGKVWHDRLVTKTGWTTKFGGKRVRVAKRSECQAIPLPYKLRFAYVLDETLRAGLSARVLPYERFCVGSSCGESLESEAPGYQPGVEAAMPSRRSKKA